VRQSTRISTARLAGGRKVAMRAPSTAETIASTATRDPDCAARHERIPATDRVESATPRRVFSDHRLSSRGICVRTEGVEPSRELPRQNLNLQGTCRYTAIYRCFRGLTNRPSTPSTAQWGTVWDSSTVARGKSSTNCRLVRRVSRGQMMRSEISGWLQLGNARVSRSLVRCISLALDGEPLPGSLPRHA
jgi:hypothetical protein